MQCRNDIGHGRDEDPVTQLIHIQQGILHEIYETLKQR